MDSQVQGSPSENLNLSGRRKLSVQAIESELRIKHPQLYDLYCSAFQVPVKIPSTVNLDDLEDRMVRGLGPVKANVLLNKVAEYIAGINSQAEA